MIFKCIFCNCYLNFENISDGYSDTVYCNDESHPEIEYSCYTDRN